MTAVLRIIDLEGIIKYYIIDLIIRKVINNLNILFTKLLNEGIKKEVVSIIRN
jgi:hypothetical protein